MKKIPLITFFAFFLLIVPLNAKAAACDYAEQNRLSALAANIKVDFEAKTAEVKNKMWDGEGYNIDVVTEKKYFAVNIYNLTKDFYLQVNNNFNNDQKKYTFSDSKEGLITFEDIDAWEVINYKMVVYAASTCADNVFRTIEITVPKYNYYNSLSDCAKAKEYSLCQPYLFTDYGNSYEENIKKINEFITNQEKEKEEEGKEEQSLLAKMGTFVVEYWYLFAGGVILVGGGTAIAIIIWRRKRII